MISFRVDYLCWDDYGGFATVRWKELEGPTIWDRDGGESPHIEGQQHLVMMEQNDDLYFKHFTVISTKKDI